MNKAEGREASFYRKKFISPLTFSLGILLFLLPFVDFKCNGMTITNATGLDLVAGRVNEKKLKDFAAIGDQKARFSKSGETRPSPFAISAVVFAILGLACSVLIPKSYKLIAFTGVMASLSLLSLLIFVQNRIDHYIKADESAIGPGIKLSADFTLWYYLSFFSFLIAAFFTWKRGRLKNIVTNKSNQSFLQEYNEKVKKEESTTSEGSSELV